MKIYLGADHRGFTLKEKIKKWLEKQNIDHEDLGAYKLDGADDYTLYAEKVASIVSDNTPDARGLLFCGSGVGMDIAANKIDGAKASFGLDANQVAAGRKDDDMNILVFAADYVREEEAKKMLEAFLSTKFDGKVKHKRRLEEIKRIEANN
jgi:ribose 5-phosphate isomerase B